VLENNIVVVIGGGHAGVEAAFAVARQGLPVKIITADKKSIGRLSCNPAVGGLAKTHLVKEVDALGGIMGFAADECALQYKTLNKTKGRAVWAVRAQVDKKKYPRFIQSLIKKNNLIEVVEKEVVGLEVKNKKVLGVFLANKEKISCSSVVVACGTFVNGLIHTGAKTFSAGRFGEKNVKDISVHLKKAGHSSLRLKTGTPPRISLKSIDLSLCEVALGDEDFFPFSISSNKKKQNLPCYVVNTNKKVHKIIEKNLNSSAMFSGKIKGVGPRYCPSIEDKIFRFKERDSHQLFLEPEWEGSDQIYINGFSTSLPYSVQIESLKEIKALNSVSFVRPGYAIEYDVVPPRELKASLESKKICGLFLAGQINGTSGYEEAAAQGLIAGINAAKQTLKMEPLILMRHQSYIGVLIDDLVTNLLDEPYRMFTSRAEHRLSLRPDNCYSRLFGVASVFGLLDSKRFAVIDKYLSLVSYIEKRVETTSVHDGKKKVKLKKHIKRPGSSLFNFKEVLGVSKNKNLDLALFEVETSIKYEGYIENEKERILKNKFLEKVLIPKEFKFGSLEGLSNESKERLLKIKPQTLGQASRIFGIRPTDITLLAYHLKTKSFT